MRHGALSSVWLWGIVEVFIKSFYPQGGSIRQGPFRKRSCLPREACIQRTCYHTVGWTERIKGESEVTQKWVTTHGRRKVRKWGSGAQEHAHCCAPGLASQPGWEGERERDHQGAPRAVLGPRGGASRPGGPASVVLGLLKRGYCGCSWDHGRNADTCRDTARRRWGVLASWTPASILCWQNKAGTSLTGIGKSSL